MDLGRRLEESVLGEGPARVGCEAPGLRVACYPLLQAGEGRGGAEREVLLGGGTCFMHSRGLNDHRSSQSYNAGTEYIGFSPTRKTSRVPSTKHSEAFGVLREGRASSH